MSKYEVCPHCRGEGKSSSYLGSFTQDEMDEMGDEFLEEYMAGRYDRPCPECDGRRVVTREQHEQHLDDMTDARTRWMEDGGYGEFAY